MCEISNSLKNKLFSLCNSQSINNVAELTQDETNIFWPSSGEFDFLSEKYVITHVVKGKKEDFFPIDSDNTGFIGHAGFQDQLGADKFPVKKFHLQNKKFSILINYGFFGGSIDNVDDSMFNTIINEVQKCVFSYCVYTIFELAGDPQPFNNKSLLSETLLLTSGAEGKIAQNPKEFSHIEGTLFTYKGLRAKVLPFSDNIDFILSEDARNAFRIFRFNTSKIRATNKDEYIKLSFEIDMDIQVNNEKSSVLFNVD
ncbi:hypothetical protein KMY87_16430 (plasmid) [Lactiplantibacillus plantarum subsp. plantarum]|uniref:hypothetical protein n=1 Tax=Lactiplantibacillus plantarum TaxID=1590 RepID=UPI001BDE7E95|nr:hypothetical protein [Lactiplantibacillus plantarum]UOF06558.1 hypothetical protein KMY87_16430 [Lactiplantibacillus plantarum subsp. plantarum]